MNQSELLLPVGNLQMCLAAIHNGADAIYIGAPIFNARGRTEELDIESLKEIMDLCHLYGVKVHVAFNILIFESELEKAKSVLDDLAELGPDAIIIQDLGLARMARSRYPKLTIHGSTQMTVTNHLAMEFLEDLEIQRFVLGRENSIEDIEKIKDKSEKELEVFVHGALCVAYSGQCFTSEGIGGRSANRGKCAQSCRFSYEIFVDDKPLDLKGRDYVVSPQDLCGINEVQKLQEIGVESFKVEGRLKKPAYVASVARNYKEVMQGNSGNIENRSVEMAQTYSRGFFPGWLHGVDHQRLVSGEYGGHRGALVGLVKKKSKSEILISSKKKIQSGQGLLFSKDVAGKIFGVTKKGSDYLVKMGRDFDISKVELEDKVFLNSSPHLIKKLEKSFSDFSLMKRIPINITLDLVQSEFPTLIFEDGRNEIKIIGDELLQKANSPLKMDLITKELKSLSRSAYICKEFTFINSDEGSFISQKSVKKLRQLAIEKLNKKRISITKLQKIDYELPSIQAKTKTENSFLNILLRETSQVDDLVSVLAVNKGLVQNIGFIYLDFEFGQHYRDSLVKLKNIGLKVALCTNRILKPGEYHHLKALVRMMPDAILARNLGSIKFLKEMSSDIKILGDFSLNVANSISAKYLFDKGVDCITTSYDLNQNQLFNLIKNSKNVNFEVTVHHYMPSFHMEHCVYASYLSKGHSFRDCGKPCEKHKVELKDQFGNKHFIKADQECRNTMFNGEAQSCASMIKDLQKYSVQNFRLELLFERGEELESKVLSYLKYIADEINYNELESKIKTIDKLGYMS